MTMISDVVATPVITTGPAGREPLDPPVAVEGWIQRSRPPAVDGGDVGPRVVHDPDRRRASP